MFFKLAIMVSLFVSSVSAASGGPSFIFNGFQHANLSLDGMAVVTPNGLLKLTNETKQKSGHAFYPNPVNFVNSSNGISSFSTTFVFAIISEYPFLSGHGIVFVVAPMKGFPGATPSQYLGLFNKSNNGNATNHVFAVELDTIQSTEFNDIDANHVGIDINGLVSEKAESAGFFADNDGKFRNLSLISGQPMQVWIEYDGINKEINVTLAPIDIPKPKTPLLSFSRDLSSVINNSLFVGFSSATGSVSTSHYVLGWSFRLNGQAQSLDIAHLPKLPRKKHISKLLTIGLPLIAGGILLLVILAIVHVVRRRKKFAELLEDWELDYGPHRFKYKDLYVATNGFKEKGLLGSGGFGRVYKGVLPKSKLEIAVKRVSHESRQGMKEFVAEIVSLGRLRHRNLVQLLGYCRRKGELLLVYDYMHNGSLDKYLFGEPNPSLNWNQRFRIIKGVASGLLYLHEEWEQVVIHRDVKASNVLLDNELNGRLGDFGLARLYDHGTDPQTTHIVGTLGYLAPEHTRTGRPTTHMDVFAFGAFLLEVATGRRPMEIRGMTEDVILVDWVFLCWARGAIVEAKDPNLGTEYVAEEIEMVLKLGLLCSQSNPMARPSMRQIVQYLEGDAPMPEMTSIETSDGDYEGFDDLAMSYSSSLDKAFAHSSSSFEKAFAHSSDAQSLLSGGR
ncbi:L-type lectin-domain containing receptor kinase IV.1-like [Momordica charantia]|uniref:non-specific serine/threonine protein kinase n=1 Tax=Momordica charantia TaxID=3673 RepID=A0A6J1CWH2_MOMCH|nr:L-type lectin-domain containing receptor kinase IV.1-like [Momordica charantia]